MSITDNIFNKNSYVNNNAFNSAYCGAVLKLLACSQHLYDRKDVAEAYRFIADMIEKGEFGWPGTFRLKTVAESDKVSTKKAGKKIASADLDTTSE